MPVEQPEWVEFSQQFGSHVVKVEETPSINVFFFFFPIKKTDSNLKLARFDGVRQLSAGFTWSDSPTGQQISATVVILD